uniref:PH-15 domain-containing protein n=1 Tax=Parascaris univalens TaxID=6257 RepID=A0A915B6F1_PARUN
MRLFGRHGNYTSLPDQQELFALPEALCGYIEKRSLTPLGWRWRRRAVLLNRSGHLIVYKNFLEGVGAVLAISFVIILKLLVSHLKAQVFFNLSLEVTI